MRYPTIFLTFLFLSTLTSSSQSQVTAQGGGAFEIPVGPCLTPQMRMHIQSDLDRQVDELKAQGALPEADERSVVLFQLPIQGASGLDWNNIYGISNYVDQDASTGIGDYDCGTRTYNGHLGTDYYTWPFGHYLKENDLAEVVAAASGTIIQKLDGQFDEQCDLNSSLTWNAVYVSHSDGSVAWYGHLKEGSLTSKAVGETVVAGEYLGVVASSGYSSGPHLHFEVHDSQNNTIDPYAGTCNNLNSTSWWAVQDNYSRMELNTHLTHDALPEHGCPSNFENPHVQSYFNSGDIIYLVPYFKDQDPAVVVTYTVYGPTGNVFSTWEHSSDQYYGSSWWWWSLQLPTIGGEGAWDFQVQFDGLTYHRPFFLGVDPPVGVEDRLKDRIQIGPNPVKDVLLIGNAGQLSGLSILDMRGRTLLSVQGAIEAELDLSSLNTGVYLLRMEMDGEMVHRRLIKE